MWENKQIAILLVGGKDKDRISFIEYLTKNYELSTTCDITESLKKLVSESFSIPYQTFNKDEDKEFIPPIVLNAKNASLLLTNTGRYLSQAKYMFNPYKIGMQKIGLSKLSTPKLALLEVGNKFLKRHVPDFCSVTAYYNPSQLQGLHCIEGVRFNSEIEMAKRKFHHVFVIGMPYKTKKEYLIYPSENDVQYINPDYTLKKFKDSDVKEIMDEIVNIVSKSAKVFTTSNKNIDDNQQQIAKEKKGFVYEAKETIRNMMPKIKWDDSKW